MDISNVQVGEAVLLLIAFIISVTVHEFGHAWAATRLGDALPRQQGRLTLSPTAHVDPIGTIAAPLLSFFASGGGWFGWGKPVYTNPMAYTRSISRPAGSALVALAGPFMNFVFAVLVSALVVIGVKLGMSPGLADRVIQKLIQLNIMLLFFNLLPIPPLDGGAVLAWFLPRSMQGVVDFLNRWGFVILLALILTQLLTFIMGPAYVISNAWADLVVRIAIS